MVDDFLFMKSALDGEVITKVSQILPSVGALCHNVGGRLLTYTLVTYMAFLPKIVFNILNAVIYMLKINLIVEYVMAYEEAAGTKDTTMRPVILSIMYLLYWFFTPDFAGVSFWMSGSIGYSWTSCIVLGFGLIYYRNFLKKRQCGNYKVSFGVKEICKDIGMLIGGICAGLSAETAACTLAVALLIYLVWNIKMHYKIHHWEWVGILAVFIGLLVLFLMPGNYARAKYVQSAASTSNILMDYVFRFIRITYYTLRYMVVPIAISGFLFFISFKKKRDYEELFFLLLAFLSIYSMLFSVGFAVRIYLFAELLIFITIGISFEKVVAETGSEWKRNLRIGMLGFSFALLLLVITEIISGLLYIRKEGEYFDRVMFYHHVEETPDGVLPGNGLQFDAGSESGGTKS